MKASELCRKIIEDIKNRRTVDLYNAACVVDPYDAACMEATVKAHGPLRFQWFRFAIGDSGKVCVFDTNENSLREGDRWAWGVDVVEPEEEKA